MAERTATRTLLGDAIRWLREGYSPRLTQDDLAELTGVPKGSISSVEAGVSQNPRGHVIDPILKFFGHDAPESAIRAWQDYVLEEAAGRRPDDGADERTRQVAREEAAKLWDERESSGTPVVAAEDEDFVKVPIRRSLSGGAHIGGARGGHIKVPKEDVRGKQLEAGTEEHLVPKLAGHSPRVDQLVYRHVTARAGQRAAERLWDYLSLPADGAESGSTKG